MATSSRKAQAKLLLDRILREDLFNAPTAVELADEVQAGDISRVLSLMSDGKADVAELSQNEKGRILWLVELWSSALKAGNEARLEKSVQEAPVQAAQVSIDGATSVLAFRKAHQGLIEDLTAGAMGVGAYAEAYLEHRQAGQVGGGKYSAQTLLQTKKTFSLFQELVGDLPPREVRRRDVNRFRDLLLKLPASHGKGGKLPALDAIAEADRREAAGEPVPRLTQKTAKRHFSSMQQLWKRLIAQEMAAENPFSNWEFRGAKGRRTDRNTWSVEDLQALLKTEWFGPDTPWHSERRWLPLLAMFGGFRLEEMARLRPRQDIVQVDGSWVIKIQSHDGWHPKSEAGQREVPVHQVLLDFGFLDLVEFRRKDRSKRLFPDMVGSGPDTKLGFSFSRQFSKLKAQAGADARTTFHSFRHSLRDELGNVQPSLDRGWIDAVLGHEPGEGAGVGGSVYMKAVRLPNLQAVVGALRYPEAVMAAWDAVKPFYQAPG